MSLYAHPRLKFEEVGAGLEQERSHVGKRLGQGPGLEAPFWPVTNQKYHGYWSHGDSPEQIDTTENINLGQFCWWW